MTRKKPRRSRPLGRSSGTRELLPAMRIFCEGKTEKRLIEDLRGLWRIPSVQVEALGPAGVPWTLVTRALKEKGRDTWVVFDRDAHPRWKEALVLAREKGLKLGLSNPCFELWGILLYRDQTAPLDRFAAQRELAKLHSCYHHDKNPYLDVQEVIGRLVEAPPRVRVLDRRAVDAGDPFGSPTTRFSDLVDKLRSLSQP